MVEKVDPVITKDLWAMENMPVNGPNAASLISLHITIKYWENIEDGVCLVSIQMPIINLCVHDKQG